MLIAVGVLVPLSSFKICMCVFVSVCMHTVTVFLSISVYVKNC